MKKEVVFGNFLFCFVSTWYMVRPADRILAQFENLGELVKNTIFVA